MTRSSKSDMLGSRLGQKSNNPSVMVGKKIGMALRDGLEVGWGVCATTMANRVMGGGRQEAPRFNMTQQLLLLQTS